MVEQLPHMYKVLGEMSSIVRKTKNKKTPKKTPTKLNKILFHLYMGVWVYIKKSTYACTREDINFIFLG